MPSDRASVQALKNLLKKWESLWAAYCLHFAYYNFCRIHKTLRVTPAMEAGITSRVWTLADLLNR
jgi:hypothetical protein